MSILKNMITVFFLAGVFFLGGCKESSTTKGTQNNQPVYDQVLKSRTLRCGYFVYAPYIMKDPNTGKLSGSFYDLTEQLAKTLNLKVEWTQETTFSTFIQDMQSGRYDVFCGGLWPLSDTAPYMAYTNSVFYTGYYLYVRAEDDRFDQGVKSLHSNHVRFATIDGETSSLVRDEAFPETENHSLPNTTDISELLMEVTSKKADVTAVEPVVADLFSKTHPNSIRPLDLRHPVKVFATVWSVNASEQKLVNWLNNGVDQMLLNGTVSRIVEKYHAGSFLPATSPYQIEKKE